MTKSLKDLVSTNKKHGIVTCAYHPSYMGEMNRRISVQVGLNKNMRSYLKNKYSKNDWGRDSNDSVPA
jgi:hypothetical protein